MARRLTRGKRVAASVDSAYGGWVSTADSSEEGASLQVTVHGHPNANTVLLWHPDVVTDLDPVTALASRIAGRSNLRVVVPVWHDGRDLLRSVRYARESTRHPPDALSVVGYGAAGIAALSLALHQRRLGIGLARATCVDGSADLRDPISGQPLPPATPRPEQVETAIDIVETDHDWADLMATAWRDAGWAATFIARTQFTWRLSPSQ